jgi:hypothetical protein
VLGRTAIETRDSPPVPVAKLTVTVALEERTPVNPFMVAVITATPGPIAVTIPVLGPTVAIGDDDELHVTRFVTFSVVDG